MDRFFKGIADTAGSIYRNVTRTVSPVVSNLTSQYNSNLRNIHQSTQQAQRVTGSVFNHLNTRLQSNLTQVQRKNPMLGLEPEHILKALKKQTIDAPIINVPFQLKYNNQEIKPPTVGETADFIRSVTIQPLARIGAEGTMSLTGDKGVYNPKDFKNKDIARFLYGDDPLRNFNDPNRPAREFLRSTGMNENQVNDIAPFLIFAGVALDAVPVTAGKSKIVTEGGKKIIKEGGKKVAKEEATKVLKELLTYEDKLARVGFSEKERAQYSVQKARELFQWDQQSAENALNWARHNAGEKKKVFNELFSQWIGGRDVAKTTGAEVGYKFRDIPEKYRWDIVRLLDDPKAEVQEGAKRFMPAIKAEYDRLFQDAKKAGMDINYIKSYITHIWAEPADVVEQKLKSASQKFKFAKERTVRTYEEGMQAGLTPKFNNPAEIIAEYTRRLEQTKANIKFVEALKKEGIIVDAPVGAGKEGFKAINGSGFPISKSKNYEGKIVEGQYYAPAEIADVINRVFEPDSTGFIGKTLAVTADISKKVQDLTMSGGVVGTPLNAFTTMAGVQREILAGRISSPVTAFIRSFSHGKTEEFMQANAETIKKMQANNIRIETAFNLDNIIRDTRPFLTKVAEVMKFKTNVLDEFFNKPTFERFFPTLQIQLFNDIEAQALAKGRNADEAVEIASKAVKRFYGVINTATEAKRPQAVQDALSTFLFAPKFRESMVNFWMETAKSASPLHVGSSGVKFNNPFSMENQMNTRFVIGTALTYLAYDKLNHHFTGKHLHENPPHTEDKLLIPMSEITGNKEDTTLIGIPFLPTLGTLPRTAYMMGKHALEGNPEQVVKDARFFLSKGAQSIADLGANQDFFGREIYDGEKGILHPDNIEPLSYHLVKSVSHPYIAALIDKRAQSSENPIVQKLYGSRTDGELLSRALELPIRFYDGEKMNNSWYYAVKDEVLKGLSEEEIAVYEQLQEKNTGQISKIREAQLRLANPSVLRAEQEIAERTAEKTGNDLHPFYKLPPEYQQMLLTYDSLPPGPDKSAISSQNIQWLKEYWNATSQFYEELNYDKDPDKGKTVGNVASNLANADKDIQPFIATPEVQKKLDHYYSLPYGTGERTRYAKENPDLVKYWEDKRAHDNKVRAMMGLPPLEDTFSNNSSSRGFSRGYSSSFKKQPFNRYVGLRSKKLTVKAKKVKPVKIEVPKLKLKLPKYKEISKPPKLRREAYAWQV